jgi:hypothetical protein
VLGLADEMTTRGWHDRPAALTVAEVEGLLELAGVLGRIYRPDH